MSLGTSSLVLFGVLLRSLVVFGLCYVVWFPSSLFGFLVILWFSFLFLGSLWFSVMWIGFIYRALGLSGVHWISLVFFGFLLNSLEL